MKKSEIRVLQFMMLLAGLILLVGCGSQGASETAPTPVQATSPIATPLPENDQSQGQAILEMTGLDVAPTLADIAPSRTPEPTATPDAMTREVTQIVQETGLSGKTFFWLDIADWINLGLSLLYVLIGYLLGTGLIRWLLPRLVKRTKTKLDDHLLQVSGDQVSWLVGVVILRFAVKRLNFVNPAIKTVLTDVCFFLIVFLVAWLLWRLISLLAQQLDQKARKSGRQQAQTESLITLMAWGLRLLVVTLVLTLILVHYGVNITGFAFVLGLIAFALSLAGRDILTDIISGAIILIDQPYRIGDRLDLPSLNSWGDVVDIGMRSTRILSVENRMVVVPNSQISKSQVVNYSYPEPSYFNTLNVVVAYDNDPDQVAKIIVDAIRKVEGVQVERDVIAWISELTEYHMTYWACWWVASYKDRYPVQDRVGRAIIQALKDGGVVLPYQQGHLNVQLNPAPPKIDSPPESRP